MCMPHLSHLPPEQNDSSEFLSQPADRLCLSFTTPKAQFQPEAPASCGDVPHHHNKLQQ